MKQTHRSNESEEHMLYTGFRMRSMPAEFISANSSRSNPEQKFAPKLREKFVL